MWLDDIRPVPVDWVGVQTVEQAKALLMTGEVEKASLDHDLGACEPCMEQWRITATESCVPDHLRVMPNCEHFGTGYSLCLWMAETGHWPKEKPTVHSMNPEGKHRMRGVIDRYFGTKNGV